MLIAMRSASRAKRRFVSVPSMAGVFLPVPHSSHVPKIWTTECAGVKSRTAATSSSEASTSELTNSDDRWQVLHTRWK